MVELIEGQINVLSMLINNTHKMFFMIVQEISALEVHFLQTSWDPWVG